MPLNTMTLFQPFISCFVYKHALSILNADDVAIKHSFICVWRSSSCGCFRVLWVSVSI